MGVVGVGKSSYYTDGGGSDFYDGNEPDIRLVTPREDGGFDVIVTRDQYHEYGDADGQDSRQYLVERQTIIAAGTRATLRSWTRYDQPTSRTFVQYTGAFDKGTHLVLLARVGNGAGDDVDELYDLSADGSVASREIESANNGRFTAILPDRRGGFYLSGFDRAYDTDAQTRHILKSGKADTAFGRDGVLSFRDGVNGVAVDPDGRLIALVDHHALIRYSFAL